MCGLQIVNKTVLWEFLKEFALSNSSCTLSTFSHKCKQPFPLECFFNFPFSASQWLQFGKACWTAAIIFFPWISSFWAAFTESTVWQRYSDKGEKATKASELVWWATMAPTGTHMLHDNCIVMASLHRRRWAFLWVLEGCHSSVNIP